MFHYLDPVQVSTPAPLSFSTVSLYAIGLLDPSRLTTMPASLAEGQEMALLLPAHLPTSVHTHPAFQEGCVWGYTEGVYTDEWSVPRLLNDLYAQLSDLFAEEEDTEDYPWTVGLLLGDLSRLAERDRTLALVGLAHLCFSLCLLKADKPTDWPFRTPLHARVWHNRAVKAYRAQVRVYREQGKNYQQAQRLALAPCVCVCGVLPEAASPCPAELLADLLAHPEFARGVREAQEYFCDSYEEAPLTEKEMLDEVEQNVSRRITQREQNRAQITGVEPSPYLLQLGWVVGTIAKGLSYAH